MSEDERQLRIERMIKTRKERGTLGSNNKCSTGIYEGVKFQSRCEERFLENT